MAKKREQFSITVYTDKPTKHLWTAFVKKFGGPTPKESPVALVLLLKGMRDALNKGSLGIDSETELDDMFNEVSKKLLGKQSN